MSDNNSIDFNEFDDFNNGNDEKNIIIVKNLETIQNNLINKKIIIKKIEEYDFNKNKYNKNILIDKLENLISK